MSPDEIVFWLLRRHVSQQKEVWREKRRLRARTIAAYRVRLESSGLTGLDPQMQQKIKEWIINKGKDPQLKAMVQPPEELGELGEDDDGQFMASITKEELVELVNLAIALGQHRRHCEKRGLRVPTSLVEAEEALREEEARKAKMAVSEREKEDKPVVFRKIGPVTSASHTRFALEMVADQKKR